MDKKIKTILSRGEAEEAAKAEIQAFIDDLPKKVDGLNENISIKTLSKESSDEISAILLKYDYSSFSDETKSIINNMLAKSMAVFSLAVDQLQPKDAIPEIEEKIDETDSQLGYEYLPPKQREAFNYLKKTFEKDNRDYSSLLHWIFCYRNLTFGPDAKGLIKDFLEEKKFPKVSGKLPSIPDINLKKIDLSNLDNQVKTLVVSYFSGIFFFDLTLKKVDKDSIEVVENVSEASTAVIILTNPVSDMPTNIIPVYPNHDSKTGPMLDINPLVNNAPGALTIDLSHYSKKQPYFTDGKNEEKNTQDITCKSDNELGPEIPEETTQEFELPNLADYILALTIEEARQIRKDRERVS